mmetsp:Transcript_20531/g.51703  ORF Transcript_20531/g.51703 Transcript_20531/m.51703 type:complete len:226 (+) Transcript_20531:460-1137(+)
MKRHNKRCDQTHLYRIFILYRSVSYLNHCLRRSSSESSRFLALRPWPSMQTQVGRAACPCPGGESGTLLVGRVTRRQMPCFLERSFRGYGGRVSPICPGGRLMRRGREGEGATGVCGAAPRGVRCYPGGLCRVAGWRPVVRITHRAASAACERGLRPAFRGRPAGVHSKGVRGRGGLLPLQGLDAEDMDGLLLRAGPAAAGRDGGGVLRGAAPLAPAATRLPPPG